ncbi:hypothetical protein Btru_011518 [Bulinus truncatus]|nr:hypothetical protein Btru_011518 [Bulinus truncatus]
MGSLYTSSSSHDWCLLAGGRLLVPALIVLSSLHSVQTIDINAASFQLPPPPFLTGNLATNNILTEAERLHNGVVSTPGSFVVVGADAIFTVTRDGQVVNIAPCRPVVIASLSSRGCRTPRECGYLISIRLNADKLILVLDAYRGLFEVNPRTGAFRHIYDSGTVVNGRASVYLNDMVLMPDGTIIMTDSSPTFDYANEFWIRFEGRPDGRLLGFNPTSGQVKEILAGLAYPTGLEITSDGQALLVAEAGRARVVRLELSKDKFFHKSIFNVNLPGMPEHIRKTKHGTYWVGLTYPRYQGDVSIMDQYSNSAISRNFLAKRRPMDQLMLMYTRRGLAVELDGNGIVVSSIHDSDGLRVKDVCEVVEADGILYVGTRDQHAVLRVMKYAVDLTMTSALQILRSRCQVMDEQINVAKAALEQQVLAQKGSQAEGSVLSTILTGNNFNIVLQNYLHQQQLAHAASSQASRPTPPRPPAAPRSRLDTIRQGLAQLQHSLLRPSNNRVAQITNNRQRPGQSQAPPPNDDPFIPLGMLPSNFVTPPRNIPQSDTSAPGRNVIPNQHSPSSPLVVHRMENGQLVTHVLLDNDFKVHDHTAQTTTTLRPTAAASRLMNYTPTPPTLMRTAGPDMPSPQGGRHPLTSSSQTNSGASGGFFDFLNGMPAQAKGKENFPFDESTPAVPLPDSGPVIPAENPYYLGLSHSEAHNNTPSEHGGAGYAQNSSSSFGKGPIHFEPAFQPSQGRVPTHGRSHHAAPRSPEFG